MAVKESNQDEEEEESEENPRQNSVLLCLAQYMGIVKQSNS